ncbi:MAG: hypothetical protein R6V53_00950 [Candidatus Woesearchaeota archaeon]
MDWRTVFGFWVLFYLSIALFYLFTGIDPFHIFIALGLLIFFLVVRRKKWYIPKSVVFFFGISILFNSIGTFPFGGTLYGLEYYDVFAHFTGFFFLTLGVTYFYPRYAILVLALMGIGAGIEISEFLGFRLFGYGSGWLMFGEGDNSQAFGPWQDSMEDMIANLGGIVLAIAVRWLYEKRSAGKSQAEPVSRK